MITNLSDPYAVEDSMCRMGAKPTKNILEDTFFFDRFLGFVEQYDKVYGKDVLLTAEKWVAEKDYIAISSFLHPSPQETMFYIPYNELAFLPAESLDYMQQKAQEIAPLLDEQKALYGELMQAYKPAESSSKSSFSYWLNRISSRHDDLDE